ncbi:MAG: hypothetical protein R8K46_09165 [Mariprofundaceae bacterium]
MKQRFFLFAMILIIGLLSSACVIRQPARNVVYVPGPPPPPKTEVIVVAPPGKPIWIAGHWNWRKGRWVWIKGHHAGRPHKHAKWVPGHWKKKRRGWIWVPGHWRRR